MDVGHLHLIFSPAFYDPIIFLPTSKNGRTWLLDRTDTKREDRTAGVVLDTRGGTEPFNLQPITLIQGRKTVMTASFSQMQTEVLETIQELETLRNMYADNDTRPGKDNKNNVLRLQDEGWGFFRSVVSWKWWSSFMEQENTSQQVREEGCTQQIVGIAKVFSASRSSRQHPQDFFPSKIILLPPGTSSPPRSCFIWCTH